LTADEERFVKSRAKRVRSWPIVGALLLTILLGLAVWLVTFAPMLANPVAAQARLEADAIPCATLALSAAILPLVVMLCLLVALALLLFVFVAFARERRYLTLIEKLGVALPMPRSTRSRKERNPCD
jgi:hypothetical protein